MNRNILIALGAFVGILIIILVIISFSGRGGKKPKPLVYPSDTFTLTWWNLYDDEDAFKDIIASYKQEHSNANIKYVQKDPATYEQDLLNALAGGTGPDIFTLKNDTVYKHLDKLYPAPDQSNFYFIKPKKNEPKKDLPTQFNELFVKTAGQDLIFENQVYGVPLFVDSLALYYNQKFFDAALDEQSQSYSRQLSATENEDEQNKIREEQQRISKLLSSPPKTWEDFVEVVKLITKKDGRGGITRSAVALGTANNVDRATDILSLLLMQNNTQMTSDDKKSCSFNLPVKKNDGTSVYPGTLALDFYTSYAQPSKETYTWNSGFPDSISAFGEGKVAMIFGYSYLKPFLNRKYGDFRFEMAPAPQIKGILDRLDLAYYFPQVVAKNTPYPLAAWDFLTFISGKENQRTYTQTSQKSTALLEPAKEKYKESQTAYLESATGLSIFDAQAYTASSWYKAGEGQKMDEIFKIMIDGVVSKAQSAQDAINAASTSCTNILGNAEPLIQRK